MTKRLLALLMAMSLIFALAACGGNAADTPTEDEENGEPEISTEGDILEDDDTALGGETGESEESENTEEPNAEDEKPETESPALSQAPAPTPTPTPAAPSPTPTPTPIAPEEPKAPEENNSAPSLSSMMSSILSNVENLPMSLSEITLSQSNLQAYLFIPYAEGYEALASEPMIGAIAHSVVLLRVPSGSDVEDIAQNIRNNADPRKWICAGAENTVVAINGNTILLVMSTAEITSAVSANFASL